MISIDYSNKIRMETLLKKIEQLPSDVYNYTKLEEVIVDDHSGKAVMITCSLFTSRWIGISTLKKDNNNNIWLKNFVFKSIMERKA